MTEDTSNYNCSECHYIEGNYCQYDIHSYIPEPEKEIACCCFMFDYTKRDKE